MAKILIIGAAGQLGSELITAFPGHDCIGADLDQAEYILDMTDPDATQECMSSLRPDVVIVTAAAHEPQWCEAHLQLTCKINAEAVDHLAQRCNEMGARCVYISTDYVFGGSLPTPLRPFKETDLPAPVNVYGLSKVVGESLVLSSNENSVIIRSSSLYGLNPCRGKGGRNFVELMLSKARAGERLRVVSDEITSPTYAANLAAQIAVLALEADPGIYHAVNKGFCSWYEFAVEIFKVFQLNVDITAVERKEFPETFPRPSYSLLDTEKLEKSPWDCMLSWQEGLKKYAAARSTRS